MPKEMLINVSAGEECRIAVVEDGRLEELYIERTSSASHVGNVYKGRVTNVESSIQAAFVDFGLGRNGFLHISDLMPTYFGKRGEGVRETVGRKMARRDRPPIQQCLRRGDPIVVQVIKEGLGTKGPTLSSYVSIPGRILVMMPGVENSGVSLKIEDEDERRRLRKILDDLEPPKDVGFIVRTAGVGKAKAEIERDYKYLMRVWENIEKAEGKAGPMELYAEGDLVTRTVRDIYTTDIERIVVDDKETAKRVKEFFKLLMPRTKNKVEVHEDAVPLFHKYGIEAEIEQMQARRVPLKSGGSLVIDQTEAVVTIDVNSGKFRDHSDAETTAFKTDLEAADEIPRQLKLRDLGGVVICDFIDLRYERHRRELEQRLAENLKKDRAKTRFLRMSEFGIIEMTRQRMRPSLKKSVYHDCPHCKGHGLVKTAESMGLEVVRRLSIAAFHDRVRRVELYLHPDVAVPVLNRKRAELSKLEDDSGKRVLIRTDAEVGLDEMRFELFDERDGMVWLRELGMEPPTQQQGGSGGRERDRDRDRRGGGGGGGGGQREREQQRREEQRRREEASAREELTIDGEEEGEDGEEADEPREVRPAARRSTPPAREPDRAEPAEREDRPARGERPNRSGEPTRDDRPSRDGRPSRDDRASRDDRPARGDRRDLVPARMDEPAIEDHLEADIDEDADVHAGAEAGGAEGSPTLGGTDEGTSNGMAPGGEGGGGRRRRRRRRRRGRRGGGEQGVEGGEPQQQAREGVSDRQPVADRRDDGPQRRDDVAPRRDDGQRLDGGTRRDAGPRRDEGQRRGQGPAQQQPHRRGAADRPHVYTNDDGVDTGDANDVSPDAVRPNEPAVARGGQGRDERGRSGSGRDDRDRDRDRGRQPQQQSQQRRPDRDAPVRPPIGATPSGPANAEDAIDDDGPQPLSNASRYEIEKQQRAAGRRGARRGRQGGRPVRGGGGGGGGGNNAPRGNEAPPAPDVDGNVALPGEKSLAERLRDELARERARGGGGQGRDQARRNPAREPEPAVEVDEDRGGNAEPAPTAEVAAPPAPAAPAGRRPARRRSPARVPPSVASPKPLAEVASPPVEPTGSSDRHQLRDDDADAQQKLPDLSQFLTPMKLDDLDVIPEDEYDDD